jgi:hypothetical protein
VQEFFGSFLQKRTACNPIRNGTGYRAQAILGRRRQARPVGQQGSHMPQQNGPGNPYIYIPPPPPPPVALYVPQAVTESASKEQLAHVAQVELTFAHKVSVLLSEAYSEILAIFRK